MNRLTPFFSVSRTQFASTYVASLLFALAICLLATPPLCATSTSSGSMQVSNLTVMSASGTIIYLDPWTAQAFAQAQNSLGGNDSQFNMSLGGLAQASASVQFASAQSSSDAMNMIQMGSAGINIPGGLIAANVVSQETLSNMFEISGTGGPVRGPVNVTFGVMLNSMQSLFTDSTGLSASSEVAFTLSIDQNVVLFDDSENQIGPNGSWTNSFSGELTNTISLNENQPYEITLFADQEGSNTNVPEPPTIALALGGAAVGFIRRLILAKRG